MAFFRKKPVIVEAVQFGGVHFAENGRFSIAFNTESDLPKWLRDAMIDETVFVVPADPDFLFIKTKEGLMEASPGDWIIKGVKGELYPCKPDIFAATYDEAPEPGSNVVGVAI